MESPFLYISNNHPWSYYYSQFPSERSRLPSVFRGGRIYEDDSSSNHNSTSCSRHASLAWPTSNNNNTSSRRRASSTPLTSHTRTHSRVMQASAAIPPSRSPPHVWSTRVGNDHNNNDSSNRPSISFGRAARELLSTLDEALDYFRPLHSRFKDQTKDIRVYTDNAVIDQVWVKKIVADVSETHRGGNHLGQGAGSEHERSAARDFRDHQVAVYNRCEDVLNAVPPSSFQRQQTRGRNSSRRSSSASSTSNSDQGLEAAALVAKMARCRDDLFPALRRMSSRYAVVGTAIKEMEVLKSNLETYREVWDAEETD